MDKWIALLPGIFVVLLLVGIGCAIKYGKAYWLISGYNTMPEEKKKNVDAAGLGRLIGNSLFAIAVIIAISTTLFVLNLTVWALATLALLLPGIIYMVVRAQRFDGNARQGGRMATQTKITIALLVVVLGGVAVGVTLLIGASSKPAEFNVGTGALEIKCVFGETVKLADIKGLEFVQARPEISSRTFGSAVGDTLRGSFAMADGSAARVFAENAQPPFVHFTVGTMGYYINCSTADGTKRLYDELSRALKQ
jgi:hypothetical protein